MITTQKALKPVYTQGVHQIQYIFDNFSESEAKRLANSYIGELGGKQD